MTKVLREQITFNQSARFRNVNENVSFLQNIDFMCGQFEMYSFCYSVAVSADSGGGVRPGPQEVHQALKPI